MTVLFTLQASCSLVERISCTVFEGVCVCVCVCVRQYDAETAAGLTHSVTSDASPAPAMPSTSVSNPPLVQQNGQVSMSLHCALLLSLMCQCVTMVIRKVSSMLKISSAVLRHYAFRTRPILG